MLKPGIHTQKSMAPPPPLGPPAHLPPSWTTLEKSFAYFGFFSVSQSPLLTPRHPTRVPKEKERKSTYCIIPVIPIVPIVCVSRWKLARALHKPKTRAFGPSTSSPNHPHHTTQDYCTSQASLSLSFFHLSLSPPPCLSLSPCPPPRLPPLPAPRSDCYVCIGADEGWDG